MGGPSEKLDSTGTADDDETGATAREVRSSLSKEASEVENILLESLNRFVGYLVSFLGKCFCRKLRSLAFRNEWNYFLKFI